MSHFSWLRALALLLMCPPAIAADALVNAAQEAQTFAGCMLTMNADCVVRSEDIDAYLRLANERSNERLSESQFATLQTRFFESMKRDVRQYVRWEVTTPGKPFSINSSLYVFVPYIQVTRSRDGESTVRAVLIGTSKDHGATWKFIDGHAMTPSDLKVVIPGYSGLPALPGGSG